MSQSIELCVYVLMFIVSNVIASPVAIDNILHFHC